MKITQEQYDKLKGFTVKQRISYADAQDIEKTIRETYNKTFTMCYSCRSAIKHAIDSIKSFLTIAEVEEKTINLEDIKLTSTIEEVEELIPEPEVDVDEVEIKKTGCKTCKKKKK